MIELIQSISIASIPGNENVILGACKTDDGSYLLTAHGISSGGVGAGKVYKWSISSSGLTLVNQSAAFILSGISTLNICLVNSSSAMVIGKGGLTGGSSDYGVSINLVEISSLYTTSIANTTNANSPMAAGPLQFYGQQIAKLTNGTVLCTSASFAFYNQSFRHYGPLVYKITSSGVTDQALPLQTCEFVTCLLPLNSGVLAGTSLGNIVEFDNSLNIVKSLNVLNCQAPDNSSGITVNRYYLYRHISGLSYYNGMIMASTSEASIVFVDWDSLKVKSTIPYFQSSFNQSNPSTTVFSNEAVSFGPFLHEASSGICLGSLPYLTAYYTGSSTSQAKSGVVFELDLISQKMESSLFNSGMYFDLTVAAGISNSIGWTVNTGGSTGTSTIRVFRVTPKARTSRTHSIKSGGVYKKGRKIIIVDDGTSAAKIDSDFYVSDSPRSYPVPDGKRIIEISLYGDGVEGLSGETSIYNT